MKAIFESDRISVIPPSQSTFLDEVVAGLSSPRKSLPCKYFYDAVGSALFDEICDLPEYYPTRTELDIMRRYFDDIALVLQDKSTLIELGSGSSLKTRMLLDHLSNLNTYIPIDISYDHLHATASDLRHCYPGVNVLPVCADYTQPFGLPMNRASAAEAVIYFPGSTIGNFHLNEAIRFLTMMAEICGPGGGLLIGVDLVKDTSILERAYNDEARVTAHFNKNILMRINAELNGTFDIDQFEHYAYFNTELSRIEMHLVSTTDQEVWIGNKMFQFTKSESIWTESSYKYTLQGFKDLAITVGWNVNRVWTDPEALFSVQYLSAC